MQPNFATEWMGRGVYVIPCLRFVGCTGRPRLSFVFRVPVISFPMGAMSMHMSRSMHVLSCTHPHMSWLPIAPLHPIRLAIAISCLINDAGLSLNGEAAIQFYFLFVRRWYPAFVVIAVREPCLSFFWSYAFYNLIIFLLPVAHPRFTVYIVIPLHPEGIPTDNAIQEMLHWQKRTMHMMYSRIAHALHIKGIK